MGDMANLTEKMTNLTVPSGAPSGTTSQPLSPRQLIRSAGDFDKTIEASVSGESFRRENFILSFTGNLEDHYDIKGDVLGQGTYGSVKKGENRITKTERAIKTLAKSKLKSVGRFRQEISIMKSIDHPNIIKLFETFEDSKFIYLVMELCQGGELFDRIISSGQFKEADARRIMKQVLSAVNYCHCNDIVHRDLKPENFLFLDEDASSDIKIIDFGLSKRASPTALLTTKCGTPYYVSPQVLNSNYDSKCDLWSAGVIMYILLCGYPPFCGENDREILKRVRAGRYRYEENDWGVISREARDLINGLLKFDPAQRVSAAEGLKHPWFSLDLAEKETPALARGTGEPGDLSERLLDHFRTFRRMGKLSKMAMTIIAQHLTEGEIHSLKKTFVDIDKDCDGCLSVQEMQDGFAKSGVGNVSDLQELLKGIDSDGSGKVDYTEFIAACYTQSKKIEDRLVLEAFRVFDCDGNGSIGTNDLLQVMGAPSVQGVFSAQHLADVKKMIKDYDANGDGVIDYGEFMKMLKTPLKCK